MTRPTLLRLAKGAVKQRGPTLRARTVVDMSITDPDLRPELTDTQRAWTRFV